MPDFFVGGNRVYVIYAAATLAIALVAVLITAVWVVSHTEPSGSSVPASVETPVIGPLALSDLFLPDELAEGTALEPSAFREPRERWNEDDAARFDVSIESFDLDSIRRESDRLVEEFFDAVP